MVSTVSPKPVFLRILGCILVGQIGSRWVIRKAITHTQVCRQIPKASESLLMVRFGYGRVSSIHRSSAGSKA